MSQKTNCEQCDGEIAKVITPLSFRSKALGTVDVPDVEQYVCSTCGNSTLTLDEANKVSQFVRDKEQHVINSLPACEFISLNQAAELLGITKQAFSKHPRIKRGFIYSITIDNKKYYYKRSVEAFKETRDGRISLSHHAVVKQIDVELTKDVQQEVSYIPLDLFGQFSNNEFGFKVFYSSSNNPMDAESTATDSLIFPGVFELRSNYISCRTTH